jgi:hypothetical protein
MIGLNVQLIDLNSPEFELSPRAFYRLSKVASLGSSLRFRPKLKQSTNSNPRSIWSFSAIIQANIVRFAGLFSEFRYQQFTTSLASENSSRGNQWQPAWFVGTTTKVNISKSLVIQNAVSFNLLHNKYPKLYKSPVAVELGLVYQLHSIRK